MKLTKQQELAVNLGGQNIIVSAGAGSGKTKVLTTRVYKHISQDKWNIDEMLVLTFTKAAASEMKKRIRNNFQNSNDLSNNKEKQLTKLDSSYIMTFDAYALFLVKKYHQVLKIDADVGIIDDNIIHIKEKEIIDEILNEEYIKKNIDFINLLNDFCIKDDNVIRDGIVSINNKLKMIYDKDEFIYNYNHNFYNEHNINNLIKKYTAIINTKIQKLDKLVDEFSNYVEDYKLFFIGIDKIYKGDDYTLLKESIDLCNSTKKQLRGADDDAKKIKDKINKTIKDLKSRVSTSKEELIKEILNTKNNNLYLLHLASKLNDRLFAYKKKNNLYEYSDIFKFAIDLVNDNVEIRNEIKDSFKEILIDEYQDTNDLQEEFINRIENNNVYMVGDIKQSIYRFRNANPSLFMDKYEKYKNNNGGVAIDLTKNFRSRKEVLDNINLIFDRIMSKQYGGANYRDGHQMEAGNTAYDNEGKTNQNNNMEILSYTYDKQEEPFDRFNREVIEAFVLAKDIKEKINNNYSVCDYIEENGESKMITRTVKYSDFAILIDRSTNFDMYRQVLTYFDIPTAIKQEEKMTDSDLMTVIKKCFRLLVCIANNDYEYEFKLAYASIARSFLIEMSDSELYDVVINNKYFDTDLYKKLFVIAKDINNKTLSIILKELIDSFDIYTKINKIGEVKDNLIKIDYMYQVVNSLNDMGHTYVDFSEYLEEIFNDENGDITYNVQNDNENAVIITTIHKSKGLEYNICYYPVLFKEFNDQELKEKIAFSKELGIITPSMIANKGLKNTVIKDIYTREYYLQDISEKIRLFYVALTRAKEKMILICPLDDKTENKIDEDIVLSIKSFNGLLNIIYNDISPYINNIDLDNYKFTNDYLIKKRNIFNKIDDNGTQIVVKQRKVVTPTIIKESSYSKKAKLIDKAQIEVMEYGTKSHQYLQTIDFNNPNYDLIDPRLVNKIKGFIDSDLMKNKDKAIAHKEYEFIYLEGDNKKHGFIDLLMEYEDHLDIIDYKLKNISDENYDIQLNGYRDYLKTITNKKLIVIYIVLLMVNIGKLNDSSQYFRLRLKHTPYNREWKIFIT